MISHIDDNLILALSELKEKFWGELATAFFEGLGSTVSYDKSCLNPVQITLFLGFNINSTTMTASVPSHKLARLRNTAKHLRKLDKVSEQTLATFIGTVSSMKLAIPSAPLFYQALQAARNSINLPSQNIDSLVPLGSAQKEKLEWWTEQAHL